MSIQVKWSAHLEELAYGLFSSWREAMQQSGSLFKKVSVVVNDTATQEWLKNYFLLSSGNNHVLMNLEFIPLYEFIDKWIKAQTYNPDVKRPARHPYSQDILAWRIYHLLTAPQKIDSFAPLYNYIGDNPAKAPLRCYALSSQLARLYSEYLNSRFRVLCSWETNGELPRDDYPEWQKKLYQLLYQQAPNSYAADYAVALDSHKNSMDRYLGLHIFDIPFMSEPILSMLKKIGATVPLSIWSFNPCNNLLYTIPHTLLQPENPLPQRTSPNAPSSPEARLLGALATGAYATLRTQFALDPNGKSLSGPAPAVFDSLSQLSSINLHVCYSPRREMESLKDALHDFFKTHPEAHPHDAVVLCGDWATYAPVIETVFGGNDQAPDSIPVIISGSIPGDSPLIHSFRDLLEFRSNRFPVSAVFNLLGTPAIARKFGLDTNSVNILHDMVQAANIHWGIDDAHVCATLDIKQKPEVPYPYTWQRGLDRLWLDMLCGPMPDGQDILNTGTSKYIRPTGTVESDRATYVNALWQVIHSLVAFRTTWTEVKERLPQEWETLLLQLIDTFYQLNDEEISEMQTIRYAITDTVNAINSAQELSPQPSSINGEALATAVLERVNSILPCTKAHCDAVFFAPLRPSTATPHRFVWLCGLNNGSFPSIQRKPFFNMVDKQPYPHDITSRQRDAYAFLKGILSARENLSLSYVGKDIKDNQTYPPSVLLSDFTDYLKEKNIDYHPCPHPLQPFSPKYFAVDSTLPPSYSKSNWKIANILNQPPTAVTPEAPTTTFTAFDFNPDGPTILELDDLGTFYSQVNKFLFEKRLGVKQEWHNKELNDNTPLTTTVSKDITKQLILKADTVSAHLAECMVETGNAPQVQDAQKELDSLRSQNYDNIRKYRLTYSNPENSAYNCTNTTIAQGILDYEHNSNTTSQMFACNITGHDVHITFSHKTIPLQTQGKNKVEHLFSMDTSVKDVYNSTLIHAWLHHLAGHALGLSFVSVCCCCANALPVVFLPLNQAEAMQQLVQLVETAFAPLPAGYPDTSKIDLLNDPYADILNKLNPYIASMLQA